MSFAQGCLLSRGAIPTSLILTNLLHVPELEVLEQRLGSGRINKGGSRRSDAGRSAAGLDLDRERPWWASHMHFGVNGRDKSSPDCIGSMILRRQARQTCRGMHAPSELHMSLVLAKKGRAVSAFWATQWPGLPRSTRRSIAVSYYFRAPANE